MKLHLGIVARLLLSATLSLIAAGPSSGADWPQFRGPQRNGVAPDESLLQSWGEGEPREVWRRELGAGYSSVAIVGPRVYTMSGNDSGEYLLALDARNGETIWQVRFGDFVEAELGDGGPRSTPTVRDDVVYTVSSQSRLMALKAGDGSEVWSVDLSESGPIPRFGYSISPLVEEGVVIVEMGPRGSSPGVTAYDVDTGAPKWNALTGPAGYSSPIAVEMNGSSQFILFRASGRELVGLSTRGEILWRHPTPEALSTIPTPIFMAPDKIFVSTSEDDFGGRMFQIRASEDGYGVEQLWQERLMRNHFNSSVLVNGNLYGFDNGTLRCLDAETGAKVWAKRGFGKGSLVSAAGLLLILGDNGELALARASPDGYEELGRKQVMTGRAWTSPSLANGRLYVRDFDEIVSLDVAGEPIGESAEGAARSLP